MPETHDPYAALRFRDYRRLLSGSVLASIGTNMQQVALGWELYRRTDSKLALGLVGLVLFLPVLLLALPAGQAADRFNRKRLLVLAQLFMTAAASGLALLSYYQGPVPLMYVALLLAGISRAFSAPARWAMVAEVVPTELLANAITWNSSGWQLASMAGPALGGAVVWLAGAEWPAFLLTAVCCAACAGLVATIRPRPALARHEPVTLRTLVAGIGFIRRTRLILATITLDLFAVLLGGATALLPVFAKDILEVGPRGLGFLQAAPAIGALIMAITLAHAPPLRRAGLALLIAVLGYGLATIGFGLSTWFPLSFIMLALTGALDNISVVVRGTLVQVLTPDAMRGRVSAVNTIFIVSSNELGAFESGLTAQWFGPVWSVVGGGIGTIVVVVAATLKWPELLKLGALDRVAVVEYPGDAEGYERGEGPPPAEPEEPARAG